MERGGTLRISRDQRLAHRYLIGHSRRNWSEWPGYLVFLMTVVGVMVHGTLRYLGSKRHPHGGVPTRRIYMYGMYERFWHWTMAVSVMALAVTGLRLHYPAFLSFVSFETGVFVHNVMAFVLVANGALSLFFHLASGEVRQYLPRPKGLVKRLLLQAMYYGKGIFFGARHPVNKTPEQKLNPLQQLTYLGLLNVLFPLQVVTGFLMWFGGNNGEALSSIGGISVIGPVHNLVSWLFLSFMVMHVYLTTTGHTVGANIKAMVSGWDDVETQTDDIP